MAIGARPRDVVWLVARQSLVLVAIGAAAGLGVAIPLAILLRSVLFGISPIDPWALGPGLLVLALVAVGASSLPAWRAARVDPIRTLRAS